MRKISSPLRRSPAEFTKEEKTFQLNPENEISDLIVSTYLNLSLFQSLRRSFPTPFVLRVREKELPLSQNILLTAAYVSFFIPDFVVTHRNDFVLVGGRFSRL